MSFRFLDDVAIADVAFEAESPTLEDLFKDSAEALLHIQLGNPEALQNRVQFNFECDDKERDMLLYRFLQELVYLKDTHRWMLRTERLSIEEQPQNHHLKVALVGEELDPARHEQRADIKAVTLHQLSVRRTRDAWVARVVVDV